MRLDDVMKEAAAVLAGITGLRVFDYPVESLTPPAGYVSYPRSVDYQQAYQQGETGYTDLPMVLVVGKATSRAARDTVAGWTADAGPQSVIAHMEAHTWTTCDDLTVTSAEFDVEKIGAVPYLTAMFKATVVGPGGT